MLNDEMQTIVLASTNPIKIAVVDSVWRSLLPDVAGHVVPVQLEDAGPEPVGEEAVVSQIVIAIQKAREVYPKAQYYVGMEGGVTERHAALYETAFVVVGDGMGGVRGISQAASFPIPPSVAALVAQGVSFSAAVEKVFKQQNVKTGQGFVGLLTNGVVSKHALYVQPTAIAFSKVLKSLWYT